jgi:hypothetical protein
MRNFKKLFAVVASLLIVSTIVPASTLGASYSDELQGAYDYAYNKGITTQASIDSANMYGQLIRSNMAKMIANYAKEVLGKTPDTTKVCNFSDVSSESAELQASIVEACQLGLMGLNADGTAADKFNPKAVITRAQFGTVLSRALYGNANNGGEPYYAAHLQALKDAGIMTNISNPNAVEVRGYVMLMMQRSDAAASKPAVCTTPENTLACSLNLDSCPTQCKDTGTVNTTEVKEGSLSVSATAVDYTSVPNVGSVKHATATFKAGSKDVKVYGVEFKKMALSSVSNAKVYFEKNGVRVTSKATFSEDKASVSFNSALIVKAGSTETVDIYVTLSGSAGEEYQFASTNVNSSALTVDGTITTPLMKTVGYTVATIAVTTGGSATSYKVDSTKLVEFGQVVLTPSNNANKDLTVKSMSFTQYGNASLSYLSDIALYRNEEKVSTDAIVNGRDVTFLMDNSIKYTSTSATYVIKAKIANADRIGDTYQFQVKYPENTQVIENTTSFRATVTPTTSLLLAVYTINGADLKFNQPAMTYSKSVVPGAKGVVFYDGTISALAAVNLENLTLTGLAGTGIDQVVKTFYVKIGGTVLSSSAIAANSGAILFEGVVNVNGTVPFTIYADIKDTAPATTIKFTNNIGLSDFKGTNEYASNGQAVTSSIGTFSPVTLTVVAANLQLASNLTSIKTVVNGDRNIDLANIEFSTTTDVQASVKSFKATLTGTNIYNFKGATVTLYDANGTALVSNTIETGVSTMSFALPNAVRVVKGSPVVFTMKVDQIPTYTVANDQLKLNVNTVYATNLITSNDITNSLNVDTATLKVVAAGTVSTVAQTFSNALVTLNGSTLNIGSVKFKPYNGDAVLKKLYITVSGSIAPLTKVVLKDGANSVITFTKSGQLLVADDINQTLTMDVTKTYDLEGTLISAATAADLGIDTSLVLDKADFESTNGVAITATTGSVVSPVLTFVKAKPTITVVNTNPQGGTKAVYKIAIAANGGDINITGLSFAANNNTATASGTMVGTLWMGNEGDRNLGTGAFNALNFNTLSNVTITNGTTQVFTLVMPVSNWQNAAGNAGSVTAELTNFSYQDQFSDATTTLHANMFNTFRWNIAPELSVSLKQ